MTGELSEGGERRAVLRAHRGRLTVGEPPRGVRLLPPGDPFLLAPDRDLLVPDPDRRRAIWPPGTVQPRALLVDGELVGTWHRRGHRLGLTTRRSRSDAEAFPLGLARDVDVRWSRS